PLSPPPPIYRLSLHDALPIFVSTPFLNANTAKPKIIDDVTLIKNVTVISPERSRALPNAVVVIRGGRIAEIGTNLVVDTQANQIDRKSTRLNSSHSQISYAVC